MNETTPINEQPELKPADMADWAIVYDGPRAYLGRVAQEDGFAGTMQLEPAYEFHTRTELTSSGGTTNRLAFPVGFLPSVRRVEVANPSTVIRLEQADVRDRQIFVDLVANAERMRSRLGAPPSGLVVPQLDVRSLNGGRR